MKNLFSFINLLWMKSKRDFEREGAILKLVSLIFSVGLLIISNPDISVAAYYSFEGIVTDDAGLPVPAPVGNARIHIYTSGNVLQYYIGTSDVAGHYYVEGVSANPDETIILSADHDGYQTQEKRLKALDLAPGSEVVDFQLKASTGDWPMFKGDLSRKGHNDKENKLSPPFNLLWSYTSENSGRPGNFPSYESSPIIYKDKVYEGDWGIQSFDLSTGQVLWSDYDSQQSGSKYIWATPVVSNDKLYVVSFGNVYCYDANTGLKLWQLFPVDWSSRSFRASPLVVNDTLYVGTLDGSEGYMPPSKFYAIDANSGQIKKSIDIDGGIYGSPVVEGDNLYLAVQNEMYNEMNVSIRCYDISQPDDMTEVWRKDMPAAAAGSSTPVVYQDYLFYYTDIENLGFFLVVLNRYTGDLVLTQNLPSPIFTTSPIPSPAIAYGNIYTVAFDTVYCLNLQKLLDDDNQTDPFVWQYRITNGMTSSLAIANGYVFFGAGDVSQAVFYSLDAYSGNLGWKYDHNGQGMGYSIASPAVSDGKVVFVSAHDFPWSGIHCFGQNEDASSAPVVTDEGQYTTRKFLLSASWVAGDSGAPITEYQYRITQDSTVGLIVRDWTSTGGINSVTAAGLNLVEGKTYYFGVKARNLGGVWSDIGYSDGIIFDGLAPITTDSGIVSGWHISPVTITLAASDFGSGVNKTYYSTNSLNPATLYFGPFTLSADGIYTIKYYSTDKAGNSELVKTAANQVKIDRTAPLGTIKINNDAVSTNTPSVTLNLSAQDTASGVAQMQFSNDNATYSAPEAYATTKAWTLPSGNGTKTVYAKFKDVAGNLSVAYSDTIVLDNAPTISSISPSFGNFKQATAYTFTVIYSDLDGNADLKKMYFLVSTGADNINSFYAYYDRTLSKLYLYDGSKFIGGYAPGSYNTIDTVYGKLNCRQTTVSGSGNNLTIKWNISFKAPLVGSENLYLSAYDSYNIDSGWQQKGSITVLDNTAPTTPLVTDDGIDTTSRTTLHATWSAQDPESNIAEYQYAIGTYKGGTNTVAWTSTGTNNSVTRTGLSLRAGSTYYFSVKAKNGSALWSKVGYSDGIKVK